MKTYVFGLLAVGLTLAPSLASQFDFKPPPIRYDTPRYGVYRIYGKTPKGFEAFYEFELAAPADNTGESVKVGWQTPIGGAVFVRPFEFRSNVQTESRGDLSVDGTVSETNVVRLRFKSANLSLQPLSYNELMFQTEPIEEIRFMFKGTFIDQSLLLGGAHISLRGTLTKVKSGKQVAQSELSFVRWSYE